MSTVSGTAVRRPMVVRLRAMSVAAAVTAAIVVAAPAAQAAPVGVPPSGNPGVVLGWGDNVLYNQATPPASLSGQSVKAVSGGRTHSLALKSNGTVVGWGSNSSGQAVPPAGLTGVTAIAAGDYHNLALRSNGTVVAWGYNDQGQTVVPAGLTGVTAITAGGSVSFALRSNGTVVGWGYSSLGQLAIPAAAIHLTAIAAGYAHVVALRSDGVVVTWGYNGNHQTELPAGLTEVTAVAAGGNHSLALRVDGTVVAWGYNGYGESTVPAGLTGVVAIAAGVNHSVALKSDGTVVAWGLNTSGQTSVPAGLKWITAISAGWNHTLALQMVPPRVSKNPVATTVLTGHRATFTAAASGIPTPSVRWQRAAPGSSLYLPIAGATGTTYTTGLLTKTDRGAHYRAVFTNPAGAATSAAAAVDVRYPPGKPTISKLAAGNGRIVVTFARGARGNPAVIGTYTASAKPTTGATIAVRGGRSPLTVTGLHNGYRYVVRVAETTSGGTVWSDPVTLTLPVLRLTSSTPKIKGTAKVGTTLTAVRGAWGPAPLKLTYRWKANGHPISGAVHSTYLVGPAVVGKKITVTITGSRPGYVTAAKTSAATRSVIRGTLKPHTPTIVGAATVGSKLTARPGSWAPRPVKLGYRWKANGHTIAGAVGATYKVAGSVRGKRITVTVTGTKAGYTTVVRTSPATRTVS